MEANSTPPIEPIQTPQASSMPSMLPSPDSSSSSNWYQRTIDSLLNRSSSPVPEPPSQPMTPPVVSSQPTFQPSASGVNPSQTPSPDVDEHGFPRNEEYLRAQGLSLADLNREYVQQQQQLEQLQQVMSDPQMRSQFLAEYDRAMGVQQRQTFPGQSGSPDLFVPHAPTDLEFWFGRIDELGKMGLPFGQQQQIAALWDEIPNEFYRHGIDYLIRA